MKPSYLTRNELANLVGCQPRSLACMKRWLERNHWPHAINIAGVPQVVREYYEKRMAGAIPAAQASTEQEPNFAALDL
ncbi:hypothetical protein AN416_09450 [Paraburkholderia caribensis]|uniref:DUF4224 domain-containing protein n=2 Tax=Paraburkholderia caribensis TaxID=75105 RepID=UPI000722E7BE|nr:hypothetical protein AN416_09450 [Paraburkholderia caribensis]AUT51971.1 DUF4224 domain-containing protein [Paraburkholderia caribensis]